MSQFFHSIVLLLILFILAEIRSVLLDTNPFQPQRLTIWDEAQPVSDGAKIILRYPESDPNR